MFSHRTGWNLSQNRYSQAVERCRAGQRPLLDLTASNPTAVGLHYDPELLSALANPAALAYTPDPRGLLSAREAVCRYYADRGDQVNVEQIILTTSTSEGYTFVFRLLCNPGDEVLVPSPSYPLFDFLADLQDVHLQPYPLFYDHGWHIDICALRERITERTRAIILVHPNNPTGSFIKASESAELNALCREHNLALLTDEVFLDFPHHPPNSGLDRSLDRSFVSNRQVLTFTLSGLSKIAGLPQMKFSWIAVSGPDNAVRDALSRLELIADTYLSMNAPIQLAAPAFFESRRSFQAQLKSRIATNLAELDRQLVPQPLCSRLEIEAGWYAVLRVPATRSDEDLAIELLENEGVLVHPGHFYDFRSDGYLVVSLISPQADFQQGMQSIIEAAS
ncbi:MAG: pyridoxal phosphate-dependent aminotransferase [Candidatus Korobacteraceae bacterium]